MSDKRITIMHILHIPTIYLEPSMVVWVSIAGNIKIRWSEN